ncbi:helix-turn-helix domain-containing protein [Streptomyces kunmingensis]|uniref:Helix-turn-helix domain-containing protein n=1 Tax=Streptomyces kunmingensis TaxID=68225 RepID=A0ABU6CDD4_9ACTN|nr:helix-turn-helix domain-containing protein [Streptomyces kunmingensis]MEB3962726.1 helix-turn-helix domain-containing protein [Streptomyces kunmingensis]
MSEGRGAFGAALRELRLAASLTLEGLAEASGVSVRGIGDLERGRRAAPQRRTVAALADGLRLNEAERERLLAVARSGRSAGYDPAGVRTFPRGIDDFVGRERELAELVALARDTTQDGSAGHPATVAVSGPPGTGKTTLALHAARNLADHFPDGQLVLDLRGMDDEPPASDELMLSVLKAFQVADRDLAKAGPQGRPGLYRQTLADRRVLLVLDNARDEAQVRPLLPSAGTGMVVVTSRRMLTGLESVHRLQLGELSPAEAAAFLTTLVGEERAAADPAALADVAYRCGHLPLALRVAGNWLATRTGWSLRRLADRLAHDERRLDALAAGDLRVSAAFDLSYRQLTPTAARLFRRLSLVPGADTSAPAAARLTGQRLYDAEDTLEELVEVGLLGTDLERYRLHDLVCLFARTRLAAEESAEDIHRARADLYRWLLETTVVAGRWFEPGHGAPPADWQGTVDLSSADKALQWLKTEGTNWLAALHAAAAAGEHARVVEVAEALHWFSDHWIFWGHWPEVFGAAVRAARALDDPLLEATQLNYHAWALLLCEGRFHDSLERSAEALAAAERAGDVTQEAWAHFYSAWGLRKLKEYAAAVDHLERAGRLFEAAGDLHGSLNAQHGHALTLSEAGQVEAALATFRSTLEFLDAAGDRIAPNIGDFVRSGLHSGIAHGLTQLEKWEDAVEQRRIAADLWRDAGNTTQESSELVRLGRLLLSAGQEAPAREAFARCLALGPDAAPQALTDSRRHLAEMAQPQ